MKRLQIFTGIAFVCSIFVFLLTIMDYLALHDIYKDYVSQEVFTFSYRKQSTMWSFTIPTACMKA
jgi:hypothetical protein